jgi:RNA polymerase sigma factor (sigma-70 family)
MSSVTAARASLRSEGGQAAWHERAGRLYEDLRAPARAMVRRAFRGAFSDEEIEDAYSNAWLGTLRALAPRQGRMGDEEIRKYVLTAVAHQASKELRRRGRKPTAPLEKAGSVADAAALPEERVTQREDSRVMRDLLTSLPRRRRAVLLLRYGWGLEPAQVCELVKGLSLRAYRKEITRGIDDLADRLRRLERGEWCADRESILKTYAAGLADVEERRQAEHHLAHCRHCADFVARLSGHLHELGSTAAISGGLDAVHDGHFGVVDRVGDVLDRVRSSIPGLSQRAGDATPNDTATQLATSGGLRGGGAAGAGALAKLAGLSTVGKVAVACITGGVAATCVATGVAPIALPHPADSPEEHARPTAGAAASHHVARPPAVHFAEIRSDDPAETPPPPDPPDQGGSEGTAEPPPPEPPPETTTPAPTVPAGEVDLGLAPTGTSSASGSSGSGTNDSRSASAEQEFGP